MQPATTIAAAITGVLLLGGSVALSSGTGGNCGPGTINTVAIATGEVSISGYTSEQLTNAAAIMNAATAAGLPQRAQILGVMTAMGESSLRNLNYGDAIHGVTNPDGTATTSIGLFQQQDSWGSTDQRLDPASAAGLFFTALAAIPNWETLQPFAVAHAVQRNADPQHYVPYFVPATELVGTLTATAGAGECAIEADAVSLAQELVTHADAGTLTGSVPDHLIQIRWIAQGKTVEGCSVDTRILQILVLAVRTFERVGISDINRRCTGQLVGAGTASTHYKNGGGKAVDFTRLGSTGLTGADPASVQFISMLDPLMPEGSNVGQANCRKNAGRDIGLHNMGQFTDTCHHLHIDLGTSTAPLNIG